MNDSPLHLLAWAYGLGLLAAAPVGPVNMVAIQRGAMGRWTHTLACGLGSAVVDLAYLALALWGGQHLAAYLKSPRIKEVLAGLGAMILVPMGTAFLARAAMLDLRWLVRARRRYRRRLPRHLWTDVGTGVVLTVINPAAPAYWVAAAAPWLARAQTAIGQAAFGYGLLAAGAGLLSWFSFLSALVRFAPQRIGVGFFRAVNAACGLLLLGFGVYCIVLVLRHGG